LVSALVGERHVQEPLLRELIDLVSVTPRLRAVREHAISFLESAHAGITDEEFDRRARALVRLVRRETLGRGASNKAFEADPEGSAHS
jgi:hypothetical protein